MEFWACLERPAEIATVVQRTRVSTTLTKVPTCGPGEALYLEKTRLSEVQSSPAYELNSQELTSLPLEESESSGDDQPLGSLIGSTRARRAYSRAGVAAACTPATPAPVSIKQKVYPDSFAWPRVVYTCV